MKFTSFKNLGGFVLGLICVSLIAATTAIPIRNDSNGYLIGMASTDKIAFRGKAPVVLPTSADQTALTDSTGGSVSNATLADGLTTTAVTDSSGGATADGTIGAVTAPTAETDSTGGSAGATLAAITTFTPSVAWNGSSVYPSAADATAIAAAITSEKNSIASLAARQAENRTAIIALTDAVKELSTQLNLLIADDATQNSNDAKLAELVNALRAALVSQGLIKGS